MPEKKPSTDDRWNKIAAEMLVGRKVKLVSYMTQKEADEMGWSKRPLVIEFDNGLQLFSSQDDEGNDGGALFTSDEKEPVLPVLW